MPTTDLFQVYNASAGSGKTFTLVKEYLKIVLSTSNPFRFQQILAITFTNKAANEMKSRVLNNLQEFSKGKKNDIFLVLQEEMKCTDTLLISRAKKVIEKILQNYGAFSITTIDSFTHKLIKTFAFDLGLPLNFEVELDAQSLLNEAVDVLISTIGKNTEVTDLLIKFSIQKASEDKAWDITEDLRNVGRILLNETDSKNIRSLKDKTVADFNAYKKTLVARKILLEAEFLSIGVDGVKEIENAGLEIKDFYRSMFSTHFYHLKNNFSKATFFDQNTLKNHIENQNFYTKSKPDHIKNSIEAILPALLNLYEASEVVYQEYILINLVLQGLIPLAVLNNVNQALETIKEENNIRLNAEFNQMISDKIKDEPTPFIYERIGEKYRYYFIDEMQDTSEMQWQNLIPLINNSLSGVNDAGEFGKLMLVGDAKQSIYRWRGGKAEQFIDLSNKGKGPKSNPFFVPKNLKHLGTNYRSYSEVINFNNTFFTHSASHLSNVDYANLYATGSYQETNKNTGGFVQLSFLEKDEETKKFDFPAKVHDIICNLDSGFDKSEVCVLVRKRSQGVDVARYLSERGVRIISSETLQLQNSPAVLFLIDCLSVLCFPDNEEAKVKLLYFLHKHLKSEKILHVFLSDFSGLNTEDYFKKLEDYGVFFHLETYVQNSFYNGVEQLIKDFKLVEESDAYVQFFLDVVLEYQQNNSATLLDFLEFWERKKDSLSIVAPSTKGAVHIMTVHKAKGLEFPVVIFPYDLDIYKDMSPKTWLETSEIIKPFDALLVGLKKEIKYTGAEGTEKYLQHREEQELDNLNILYVALTRAVEQLYIVSEYKISKKGEENLNFYSGYFINYIKDLSLWDSAQLVYSFGDEKRISIKKKDTENLRLLSQKTFVSSSWDSLDISVVTKASVLWGTSQGEAINYGNLVHAMLAEVKTKEDIDAVLNAYISDGSIQEVNRETFYKILMEVVLHPDLLKCYEKGLKVYNEREILMNNGDVIIPDRLVFYPGNRITIIDYKTGNEEKKHHKQVVEYAAVLLDLGYEVSEMLLVYLGTNVVVRSVQ
ncbi:MAG: UvrD-helicase domain-containing protein [Flavobacteriaceae bacterium]|nr:UvrD-helicase domain-containing protein [Flavobacteriaceae bacterium]